MAFNSPVIRTDTTTVSCSYKSHCQGTPCVHHPHNELYDMKKPSNNSTHHIYERSLPLPPPSTNPSRRVVVKLLIIFFVTFTSATLLQALGYLLFAQWGPSSPLHAVNEVPLPIVVRPSIGLREPYVAHPSRYPRTIVSPSTPTPFKMAVR